MGRYVRNPQTAADQQILKAALDAFDDTEAASPASREALPAGEYIADVVPAGSFSSVNRNGTPLYKIEFKIAEGPHTGRRIWFDIYLTAAALPYAKTEFAKIGITRRASLEQPLPAGIRVRLKIGLERNDSGEQFNVVRGILELVSFSPPIADPFSPAADSSPAASQPQQRLAVDPLAEVPF